MSYYRLQWHDLREWRRVSGLDPEAFGKEFGVSGESIQRMEAGELPIPEHFDDDVPWRVGHIVSEMDDPGPLR